MVWCVASPDKGDGLRRGKSREKMSDELKGKKEKVREWKGSV